MDARIKSGHDEWGVHTHQPAFSNSSRLQPRLRDLAECFFREVFFISALSELRAQGMPGADAPDSRVCNGNGRAHTRCQVTPESPGIPHAMVYGLFVPSPVLRAFWPPSPARLHANLTPASGCQDHTTSPSAITRHSLSSASASTASRPASVTIATRPSVGRDGSEYNPDLYF